MLGFGYIRNTTGNPQNDIKKQTFNWLNSVLWLYRGSSLSCWDVMWSCTETYFGCLLFCKITLVIVIICLILSQSLLLWVQSKSSWLIMCFSKTERKYDFSGTCVCVCRPVFEGCFSEEPLPYSDPTGAAGGGNCRLDSPSQEGRLQTQRIRGQDSRGHGHTPQNRPHGHQPPDLPEGYGQ